jgi:hypothetical protein
MRAMPIVQQARSTGRQFSVGLPEQAGPQVRSGHPQVSAEPFTLI